VLRDPRLSAQEGGQRHPQLVGTYFLLKQGEEFAKQAYPVEAERNSFLTLLRERVAEEIERGEALRTTHFRDRARTPEPELNGPDDSRAARQGRRPQDPRSPEDPEPVR
jgi:hypothetical protein